MSVSPRFERNLGFYSTEEQGHLQNSSIGVAGAGGDGALLAETLVRMGVGEVRLADPDPFEIENINRQAFCNENTIGVNKAIAVGEGLQGINPDLKVATFTDGITPENTPDFVQGLDLVIDETEYTMQWLAVMLGREARKQGVPNMTALNIGFAALVTTYEAEGTTIEKRLGFTEDQPLDEIMDTEADLARWLPYLPKYGDLKVLEMVAKAEKSAPSVAPGVAAAAAIGSTQATLNLLKAKGSRNHRPDPIYAPNARVIDVMTGESKLIKYSRASHYRHLASMVARNVLKRTPQTSY